MQVRYEKLNTRMGGYLVTIRQGERVIDRITVDTLSAAKKIRKAYRPVKHPVFAQPGEMKPALEGNP
jgi:hypothetical protein